MRRVRRQAPPLSLGGSYVRASGRSRGVGAVAALDNGYYSDLGRMAMYEPGDTPPIVAIDEGGTPTPVIVMNDRSSGGVGAPSPNMPGGMDTRIDSDLPGTVIVPVPPGTILPDGSGIGGVVPQAVCGKGYFYDGTQCIYMAPGQTPPILYVPPPAAQEGPRQLPPLPVVPTVDTPPIIALPAASADVPWGWILAGAAAAWMVFGKGSR